MKEYSGDAHVPRVSVCGGRCPAGRPHPRVPYVSTETTVDTLDSLEPSFVSLDLI